MKKYESGGKGKGEWKWLLRQAKPTLLPLILIIALSMLSSVIGVSFVMVSKNVIDAVTSGRQSGFLSSLMVMMLVVFAQLTLQSLNSFYMTRTSAELDIRLKDSLFSSILRKDWMQITSYHSGDLATRFSSDLHVVTNGIMGIVPAIAALLAQLISAFCALFVLDRTFAFFAFIIGPVVVAAGKYYSKKMKKIHIECQESDAVSRSFLQESLQNLLLIKTFGSETDSAFKYVEKLRKFKSLQIKRNNYGILSGIGLSLGFWIGYVFAIAWGSYRLQAGLITVGTLTAFVQLVNQVQSPFISLTRIMPQIASMIASAGRLMIIEAIPEEQSAAAMQDLPAIESLRLDHVSFSYQQEKILDRVTAELHRGDFAILEGPSGEGKTTLLRILLGLVRPDEGAALLTEADGTEVEISSNSRRFFSYVPQGNSVLSGTIAENIAYGCPNAAEQEIWRCAEAACLTELIEDLPHKLNTVIGERGLGLSEGQAQRLAIARALMRKTPILLLDEATSALDEVTEAKIIDNLKEVLHDRICIFVSHRKSVGKACDKVLLLKNGCIEEIAV